MGRIGQFFKDVGRRRVLPTVALYIVAAWVAIQVADLAIDAGVIRWPLRNVFIAAILGYSSPFFSMVTTSLYPAHQNQRKRH